MENSESRKRGNRPYKVTAGPRHNVRLSPDEHKMLDEMAQEYGDSGNEAIRETVRLAYRLRSYLNQGYFLTREPKGDEIVEVIPLEMFFRPRF